MRYTVGMICLIVSLLLSACSENDEEKAERYSATFLDLESYDFLTPEDVFLDIILPNVEFEKEEIGKGEPVEVGGYTVQTETTYDLIIREAEAELYIKTKKDTDKMYKRTCLYKYVFKPGTYGRIEVSENTIAVNGYPYCGLTEFAMTRTEPIGEKYSQKDTESEIYKGVFSYKSKGGIVTLSNSDYVFEIMLENEKCHLAEVFPNAKDIGILERYRK